MKPLGDVVKKEKRIINFEGDDENLVLLKAVFCVIYREADIENVHGNKESLLLETVENWLPAITKSILGFAITFQDFQGYVKLTYHGTIDRHKVYTQGHHQKFLGKHPDLSDKIMEIIHPKTRVKKIYDRKTLEARVASLEDKIKSYEAKNKNKA